MCHTSSNRLTVICAILVIDECASKFLIDVRLYSTIYKAVPLQAWSGPDASRKLRFPDYVTTAQDGGKVVSLAHRPPLPPGNAPGTHLC